MARARATSGMALSVGIRPTAAIRAGPVGWPRSSKSSSAARGSNNAAPWPWATASAYQQAAVDAGRGGASDEARTYLTRALTGLDKTRQVGIAID
jgi:hypothetical protein